MGGERSPEGRERDGGPGRTAGGMAAYRQVLEEQGGPSGVLLALVGWLVSGPQPPPIMHLPPPCISVSVGWKAAMDPTHLHYMLKFRVNQKILWSQTEPRTSECSLSPSDVSEMIPKHIFNSKQQNKIYSG